jgi:4-hydroxy-4-methyl-2-oxoglutarate aldolase
VIDEAPMLTIKRRFERPASALVARFKDVPLAFICDAMNGGGALDYRIKPVPGTPETFVGVALTCYCGPGDNLAVAGANVLAQAGDVVVAATDNFTGLAVVGDLLIGMMKNRGVAAFVTDGVVRDLADLRRIGLPIFASGVTPNSVHRSGPGTLGFPVTIGGITVASGDIVIGDCDGVVVVPQERAAAVLERLDAVRANEAGLLAKVQAGLDAPPFGTELLASDRVRFVD